MLHNENVTVRQLVYLLMSCGFRKCELWKQGAYINANHNTKEFRSHRIASKKMDLLHEAGMDYKNRKLIKPICHYLGSHYGLALLRNYLTNKIYGTKLCVTAI